jgi:hypothetical protein
VTFRLAAPRDAPTIFALLEEVAPEIPLTIRDDLHRQQWLAKVQEWCALRSSIVALRKGGKIVGFQIATPTNAGERMGNPDAPLSDGIMLQYAGVTKHSRGQGIFPALIENLKRGGLPLYATVKHSNRSAMADRLVKMGFAKFGTDAEYQQDHFRWLPGAIDAL